MKKTIIHLESTSYAPIAVIFLHPACNMSCDFCITEGAVNSMSFNQALGLLDFLKEQQVQNVIFGGGEPFTWNKGLLPLTSEAKKRGFFVQIGTNGIALPENFEWIETIDRYILPLDSVVEGVHNSLRHYQERHYSIILNRLHQLKEAGKSVTVSTVVTRKNVFGLKDIGDYLSEYSLGGGKVHAWHLYRFLPEGRGGRIHQDLLSLDESLYDSACAPLVSRMPFAVYRRKNMYESKTVGFFWYERGQLYTGGAYGNKQQWRTVPLWLQGQELACSNS